jgi:hypothetical protein
MGQANIVGYITATAEKYTCVSVGGNLRLSCLRISPDGPLLSEQKNILKQEVLETTNRLLSFDTTRIAQKTTPPVLLLLRVYSLPWERISRIVA